MWVAVVGVRHNIAAARQAGRRRVAAAVERRQLLPAEHQAGRLIVQAENDFAGFAHFVGVGGTQHDQIRNRAQRHQLLDRLMGRAVFAEADRSRG